MTIATYSANHSKPCPHKKQKSVFARRSLTRVNQNTWPYGQSEDERRATISPVSSTERRVRFAPLVQVTARRATVTDLKHAWYSADEYKQFETSCRCTVASLRNSNAQSVRGKIVFHLSDDELTDVGLEDFISIAAKEHRDYRKALHSHHVLKAQYNQRCQGVRDEDSLAAVAEMYSSPSLMLAFQRGASRRPQNPYFRP